MKKERPGSAEPATNGQPLIIVARAVKTRGLKGEIVADLLTDFPERFEGTQQLFAVAPDGQPRVVKLERHWFQKDRIVLKFVGYDNIESAAALVGNDFAVLESERRKLAADQFYDWELEGCEVGTVSGQHLGCVREVLRTGGVEILVVEGDQGHQYMIPMVSSILVGIDIGRKSILIDPLEGLLEL